MVFRWLILLCFLALGSIIGLLAREGVGEIVLFYGVWQIEAPVWLIATLVIIAMAIVAFIVKLSASFQQTIENTRDWLAKRKLSQANINASMALSSLIDGNVKNAKWYANRALYLGSDAKLINYMILAQTAQEQADFSGRNSYIESGLREDPKNKKSYLLIQAKLQIAAGENDNAERILSQLYDAYPKDPQVLKLLTAAQFNLEKWQDVEQLLPQLNRYSKNDGANESFNIATYSNLLKDVAKKAGKQELLSLWSRVPKKARQTPQVIIAYVESLQELELSDDVATVCIAMLRKFYIPELSSFMVKNPKADLIKAISLLEKWLTKENSQDTVLLTALGELYLANEVWGKAKQYLEQSIAVKATTKAYNLLGELYEAQGDGDNALKYFRLGCRVTGADQNLTNRLESHNDSSLL